MVILELVGQGIRNLPPAVRTPLKPGYTLFVAPQRGVSLWSLMDALCFPDPRGGQSAALANPSASVSRLGVTFQGRDGQTYRLVREVSGAGTLARMEQASGKFLPITQASEEIAQYLRAQLGLPTRGTYEGVLSLSAAQYPSQARAAPAPGPATLTAPGLKPAKGLSAVSGKYNRQVAPAADLPAARKTLAILKEELTRTKEVDELQFKLDGAQRRVFESGNKVKAAEALRQELAQAQAQLAAAPSLESLGLPPNVVERAGKMEMLEKNRDQQLTKLEQEREQFLGSSRTIPPLYKDQLFYGPTLAGLGFVALGLGLGHGWRYLALLDMPAFGVAAITALRWVTDLQANENVSRRKQHYDEKEKQISDAFESEVLSVKTAMKLLNVETAEELMELLGRRQILEGQVKASQARLAGLESDPALLDAQRDLAEAQSEIPALEARLNQLASYARPLHTIENELEEVELSIKAAESPGSAGATIQATAAMTAAAPAVGGAPGAPEDFCPRLLDAVTDVFQLDVVALGKLMGPRAAQYLTALTDRRLVAIDFGLKGEGLVLAGQTRVPVTALEARDRDLVYLALKLTLMEKVAEKVKVPLFFDDPFGAMDPAKQQLLGRMLKHLGTKTQVLHLAASGATQALADAAVDLTAR